MTTTSTEMHPAIKALVKGLAFPDISFNRHNGVDIGSLRPSGVTIRLASDGPAGSENIDVYRFDGYVMDWKVSFMPNVPIDLIDSFVDDVVRNA